MAFIFVRGGGGGIEVLGSLVLALDGITILWSEVIVNQALVILLTDLTYHATARGLPSVEAVTGWVQGQAFVKLNI